MRRTSYSGVILSGPIEATPEWSEIIAAACRASALGLRVSLTAKIESINLETLEATVVPVLADDDGEQIPPIPSTPVILPGGEEGLLFVELGAGDEVELLFADRSEDAFFEEGTTGAPPDSRRSHSLTDARAFPGPLVGGEKITPIAGAKVAIQTRDGSVACYVTSSDVVALPSGSGFVRLGAAGANDPVVLISELLDYIGKLHAALSASFAAVPVAFTPPPPPAGATKVRGV